MCLFLFLRLLHLHRQSELPACRLLAPRQLPAARQLVAAHQLVADRQLLAGAQQLGQHQAMTLTLVIGQPSPMGAVVLLAVHSLVEVSR